MGCSVASAELVGFVPGQGCAKRATWPHGRAHVVSFLGMEERIPPPPGSPTRTGASPFPPRAHTDPLPRQPHPPVAPDSETPPGFNPSVAPGSPGLPHLFLVFLDGFSEHPTSNHVEKRRKGTEMAPSTARALVEDFLEHAKKEGFSRGDGEEVDVPLMDVLEAMDHLSERSMVRCKERGTHVEGGERAREEVHALKELQEMMERVESSHIAAEESRGILGDDGPRGREPEVEPWQAAANRARGDSHTPPTEKRHESKGSSVSFDEEILAAKEGEGDTSDGAPASDPGGVFDFSDDEEFPITCSKEAFKLDRTYRRIKSCAKLKECYRKSNTHSAPCTPSRAPLANGECSKENKERARFLLTIKSAWQVLGLLHAQARMLEVNGNYEDCTQACTEGIRMANHLKRQTLPAEDEIGFTACALKRLLGELFLMRASCQLRLATIKHKECGTNKEDCVGTLRSWGVPHWRKCTIRSPTRNVAESKGETSRANNGTSEPQTFSFRQVRQLYQKAVEDAVVSMTITSQPQAYVVLGDSLVGLDDPAGALLAYIKGLTLTSKDVDDETQEELYGRLLSSKINEFAFENSTIWDRCSWWPLTMYPEEIQPNRRACDQVLQILQQGVK